MKNIYEVSEMETMIAKMIKKDLKNKNEKTLDAYQAKTLERVLNQAVNNAIMKMVQDS